MIKIENLVKNYSGFSLNISLDLPKGQVSGLVGKNGAGKSTTIKSILGLIKPDGGSVKVFGKEASALSSRDKENIGVALSESGFSNYLTVGSIITILKNTYASFDEQLSYFTNVHSLSDEELNRIHHKKLKTFLADEIASRMSAAALSGKLYKEKPFVYGSDSKDLFGDENTSDELILVQGIIDVFFEEDDGIVLLDYKTDRVDEDSELVLRYEKQLQLYKSAIEKAYNIPVKEVLLYSFALEKTISISL